MKRETTDFEGVLIFKPQIHTDTRGRFLECFRQTWFSDQDADISFVQDNLSLSDRGVLRGLHFQNPLVQGKLVQVVRGSVFDVIVDLRMGSKTYGQWFGLELSARTHNLLWIPSGFAHGFQALEDNTVFHYKCTGFYNRDSERSLRWNDPDLGINWPLPEPRVSEKDAAAPFLKDLSATELF